MCQEQEITFIKPHTLCFSTFQGEGAGAGCWWSQLVTAVEVSLTFFLFFLLLMNHWWAAPSQRTWHQLRVTVTFKSWKNFLWMCWVRAGSWQTTAARCRTQAEVTGWNSSQKKRQIRFQDSAAGYCKIQELCFPVKCSRISITLQCAVQYCHLVCVHGFFFFSLVFGSRLAHVSQSRGTCVLALLFRVWWKWKLPLTGSNTLSHVYTWSVHGTKYRYLKIKINKQVTGENDEGDLFQRIICIYWTKQKNTVV